MGSDRLSRADTGPGVTDKAQRERRPPEGSELTGPGLPVLRPTFRHPTPTFPRRQAVWRSKGSVPGARAGSRRIPSGRKAARGNRSALRGSGSPPLARVAFPTAAGALAGTCLSRWNLGATALRRLRCPGSASFPTRGREATLPERPGSKDRPAPSLRKPGSAGQPGFRNRMVGLRRDVPSPNSAGGSSGLPSPRRDPANRTDLRPEGRCALLGSDPKIEPTRRSSQQGRKEPKLLQDRPRALPKRQPEGNRSLEPRLRRTEARRRGPHPPQSGAFTCKQMLARIAESDNTKLPKRGEILCIVSCELHISFTCCPQLCPQQVETRGEVRDAQGPARPAAKALRARVKTWGFVDLCCAAV